MTPDTAVAAVAVTTDPGSSMMLGAFPASLILMMLLRMIYNTWDVSNRWKPWIAFLLGVGLGLLYLFITLAPNAILTAKMIVESVFTGMMMGMSATGAYEMTKKKGEDGNGAMNSVKVP